MVTPEVSMRRVGEPVAPKGGESCHTLCIGTQLVELLIVEMQFVNFEALEVRLWQGAPATTQPLPL